MQYHVHVFSSAGRGDKEEMLREKICPLLRRDESSSINHQHFSNLLMIYPLYLVNIEQEGTTDVLKRTFDHVRGTGGPGERQAMVQAHAGSINTAIGLGDLALEGLKRLQDDLYPNGM